MDPRAFPPGPGIPFPGWMPPPGTPLPPGMAGPPPPGWLPIPLPPPQPLSSSPHFIPMNGPPPPGMMPFQMGPFPHQQASRPFLPLGAIPPPPPQFPNSAPPTAPLPPAAGAITTAAAVADGGSYPQESSTVPASPTLSQISQMNNSGQQQFTPRAQRSVHSRAQSASTSPRARSVSSGGAFAAENVNGGRNKTVKNTSTRNEPGPKSAATLTNGNFNNNSNGSFGTYGPKSPPRPQSGSASRNSPKRVSSVQPSRRAGSARPRSAANFAGSGGPIGAGPFSTTGASGSVSSLIPIDDSDNIKVAIRIRPLNSTESSRGDACMLQVSQENPQHVCLTVPASATSAPSSSLWQGPHGAALQPTTRTFQFHSCIGPESGQEDVMRLCGIPQLLDAALDGYNATILAYGQTGSGKTYTIIGHEDDDSGSGNFFPSPASGGFGSGEDEGIVSRSLAYIFKQVESRNLAVALTEAAGTSGGENDLASNNNSGGGGAGDIFASSSSSPPTATSTPGGDGCKYSIRASYSEIYNEALYDLLCLDQRQLSLRWDPVKGFHAPDLTLQECVTLEDAQEVVACGLRHRRVGSHSLNLESSRSHAILTVYIDAVPVRPDAVDFGSTRMGKVVFVDLAGSERLKDSHSEGIAMKETASINRSLFMLGKVISCLASGAKGSVVPYRESKLTKLLMDSLGGSALSLMIACCSPSIAHLEETLSTLSYATRAKNIKNAPAVQMDPQQAALAALRREIRVLRAENAFLRDQIMMANIGNGASGDAGLLSPTATGLLPCSSCISPSQNGYSPGSSPSPGSGPLPAHSVMLPVPTAPQEELSRRLNDAQRLLGTLSSENSRLAAENERLRAGGLQVAGEYSGAVEEIEWLRSKLARLEVSLMGAAAEEGANNQAVDGDLDLPLPLLPAQQEDGGPKEKGSDLTEKQFSSYNAIEEGEESHQGKKNSSPSLVLPGMDAEDVTAAENILEESEKIEADSDNLVAKARATPLPDGYSIDMEADSD